MKHLQKKRIMISFLAVVFIATPSSVIIKAEKMIIPSKAIAPIVIEDTRASRIDAYFKKNGMPLEGWGKTFVEEADKNGIDWRLLAAISVKESTGGKHLIPGSYNAFGYGSGTAKFKNYNESIAYISDRLAHGRPYAGKTTQDKLKTYNPPSVEPLYSNRVMAIMEQI